MSLALDIFTQDDPSSAIFAYVTTPSLPHRITLACRALLGRHLLACMSHVDVDGNAALDALCHAVRVHGGTRRLQSLSIPRHVNGLESRHFDVIQSMRELTVEMVTWIREFPTLVLRNLETLRVEHDDRPNGKHPLDNQLASASAFYRYFYDGYDENERRAKEDADRHVSRRQSGNMHRWVHCFQAAQLRALRSLSFNFKTHDRVSGDEHRRLPFPSLRVECPRLQYLHVCLPYGNVKLNVPASTRVNIDDANLGFPFSRNGDLDWIHFPPYPATRESVDTAFRQSLGIPLEQLALDSRGAHQWLPQIAQRCILDATAARQWFLPSYAHIVIQHKLNLLQCPASLRLLGFNLDVLTPLQQLQLMVQCDAVINPDALGAVFPDDLLRVHNALVPLVRSNVVADTWRDVSFGDCFNFMNIHAVCRGILRGRYYPLMMPDILPVLCTNRSFLTQLVQVNVTDESRVTLFRDMLAASGRQWWFELPNVSSFLRTLSCEFLHEKCPLSNPLVREAANAEPSIRQLYRDGRAECRVCKARDVLDQFCLCCTRCY